MRKRFCLISLLFPFALQAQNDIEGIYLLNDFTVSVATAKQGPPIQAPFNYDCVKQEMQFTEGSEILKLEPINNIDTLYLGKHKMVPYLSRFLEVIHITHPYCLLVDHKRRVVNQGKKGAMGTTTQGTAESIDFSKSGRGYNRVAMPDNAVYKCKDESSYVLIMNNKARKFNNAKSFIKIFPAKKEQIEAYVKEQNVTFHDSGAVVALLDFTLR